MTDATFNAAAVHTFSMLADEPGKSTILLDAEDISSLVSAVTIDAVAGDVCPVVTLTLSHKAAQATNFDGLARVQVVLEDPGPAAAKFLSAIDPELLEQAALNSPNLTSGPQALTRAMIDQLIEWAHGRS